MKTTIEKVYNLLRSREPGGTFRVSALIKVYPGEDKGIYSAVAKMRKAGVIKPLRRGVYTIEPSLKEWGERRTWTQLGSKGAAKKKAAKKQVKRYDGDVLQNLLDAMAAAEPEIRRLLKIEQKLKELTEA